VPLASVISLAENLRRLITPDQHRVMIEAAADSLDFIPDHVNRITVGEWAEEKRILPVGLTSMPGPFRWNVAPYMREIADCLSESSDVTEVAVMKGAQVTFTVGVLENFIGYIIDVAPGPTMFISADKGMAETSVELRVDRMIESAGLASKVYSQSEKRHNKKTGDTKSKKEFAGGFLLAIGPNVGAKLRIFSVRYEVFDEVDAYPMEIGAADKTRGKTANEGDPVALAKKRTVSFERIRKILYGSTPLDDATSRIKPLFKKGDQRYYFVPCKYCGHMQRLRWRDDDGTFRLKFKTDETGRLVVSSVHYECEKCGRHWKNEDKEFFLPAGEWRPTAEPSEPGFRSYHISALYSPVGMQSWEGICQEWIDAKEDLTKLRAFVNTVLGETWVEQGEAPRYERIMMRREEYKTGSLPPGAQPLIVTVGADVQADRIAVEIVAWGRDKESWSVQYVEIPGNTADIDSEAWTSLAKLLSEQPAGIPVFRALIDSGFNSPVVYQFCERFSQGVLPVKGDARLQADRGTSRVYALRDVPGYYVKRVDLDPGHLKQEIYNSLGRGTPEGKSPTAPFPGYCHFPFDYDEKYFRMLTAEQRVRESTHDGKGRMVWHLQHGRRNEALDCRVYALGCLSVAYGERLREIQEEDEELAKEYSWTKFWDEIEALKTGT
jgi:phage terminase large subunit GpA-like protein